jgi:translation initiation factor eIF-2B subunit delta
LSNRAPSEKLSSFLPPLKSFEIPGPLKEWESIEKLRILNICYDITPAKFITVVACEAGLIPSTLVLSLLRSPSLVIEK